MKQKHLNKKRKRKVNPLTLYNMRGKPKLKRELKKYLSYCEDTRRMSPRTMEYKNWIFNEFIRNIDVPSLEKLTNADVDRWVATMTKRGLSAVTINHCLTQLIVMMRWQHDMGMDIKLKIPLVIKQKEPDSDERMFYRRDEIAKALSYADRREWLLIALFFDCGFRIEELQNLRLSSIRGRDVSVLGKRSKLRYVMMSEETRRHLDDWIKSEGIDDYVFPGRNYTDKKHHKPQPISQNQIRRSTRRVFECAGLQGYHPHKLRHSFAMDLLMVQKLSVREIQYLLGHSKIETTEVYLERLSRTEQSDLWREKRFSDDYTLDYQKIVENKSRKSIDNGPVQRYNKDNKLSRTLRISTRTQVRV